jgi:hypothetical protein
VRDNPDLDDIFLDYEGGSVNRKPVRQPDAGPERDKTRRLAFRVLAMLSRLDAPSRRRVLKAALRLNES